MPQNFRAAALDRIEDSRILFVARRWTAAIYLARLGLECELKARLLERRGLRELPAPAYTHDLWALLKQCYRQPVPHPVRAAVSEINGVDLAIRYNIEEFDGKDAARFLARVQGVLRWLSTV